MRLRVGTKDHMSPGHSLTTLSLFLEHRLSRLLCGVDTLVAVELLLRLHPRPYKVERLPVHLVQAGNEHINVPGEANPPRRLLHFLPWGVLRALFVVFGLDPVFGLSRVRLRLLLNLLAIEAATLAFFRLLLNLLATEAATLAFFRLLLIL